MQRGRGSGKEPLLDFMGKAEKASSSLLGGCRAVGEKGELKEVVGVGMEQMNGQGSSGVLTAPYKPRDMV